MELVVGCLNKWTRRTFEEANKQNVILFYTFLINFARHSLLWTLCYSLPHTHQVLGVFNGIEYPSCWNFSIISSLSGAFDTHPTFSDPHPTHPKYSSQGWVRHSGGRLVWKHQELSSTGEWRKKNLIGRWDNVWYDDGNEWWKTVKIL